MYFHSNKLHIIIILKLNSSIVKTNKLNESNYRINKLATFMQKLLFNGSNFQSCGFSMKNTGKSFVPARPVGGGTVRGGVGGLPGFGAQYWPDPETGHNVIEYAVIHQT